MLPKIDTPSEIVSIKCNTGNLPSVTARRARNELLFTYDALDNSSGSATARRAAVLTALLLGCPVL